MAEIRTVFAVLGDGIPTYWAICAATDPANPSREFVVQTVRATLDVLRAMHDRGLFAGPDWRARHGALGDAVWIQEDPHRHPNDPSSPKRLMQGGIGDRYRPASRTFTDRPTVVIRKTREQREIERLLAASGLAPLPDDGGA